MNVVELRSNEKNYATKAVLSYTGLVLGFILLAALAGEPISAMLVNGLERIGVPPHLLDYLIAARAESVPGRRTIKASVLGIGTSLVMLVGYFSVGFIARRILGYRLPFKTWAAISLLSGIAVAIVYSLRLYFSVPL